MNAQWFHLKAKRTQTKNKEEDFWRERRSNNEGGIKETYWYSCRTVSYTHLLCPIYSFYLNEKLNLIKKSKSTVTRPDMIDYELCKIQFMEEKMSRIYNALIELVAAVFIIPLWGIYEKFFFQSWKRTMVYMIFGFYLAVVLALVLSLIHI